MDKKTAKTSSVSKLDFMSPPKIPGKLNGTGPVPLTILKILSLDER